MARNKRFLPILLVLSILLAPLQGLSAGETAHMDSMPANCIDCEMHEGGKTSCDNLPCLGAMEICGSANLLTLPPQFVDALPVDLARFGYRRCAESRYRSRLEFSIYRPPIA